MIDSFEPSYKEQWEKLPDTYKIKMLNAIVPFEITVTDLQGKKKLSQNKTISEQQKIVQALAESEKDHEKQIGHFIKENL